MTARETYEYWVRARLCGPKFWDVPVNTKKLNDWINTNRDGLVTLDTLAEAEDALRNYLDWKPDRLTKEEIDQRAAEEKLQKDIVAQNAVIEQWLRDEAPLGLLINGRFYLEDANKITQFVVRNHGAFTPEALRDAVKVLTESNALTYWDRSPAAMELRNQPALPPRRMSETALIEAGLKQQPKQKSHADTDGQFNDPTEKIRNFAKKLLGNAQDPYEIKANQLVIQNRSGRVDNAATEQLRQVIVKRNNVIDWELTYKKRNELCDGADRLRNRD
jgi:hypothetical protein